MYGSTIANPETCFWIVYGPTNFIVGPTCETIIFQVKLLQDQSEIIIFHTSWYDKFFCIFFFSIVGSIIYSYIAFTEKVEKPRQPLVDDRKIQNSTSKMKEESV